MPQPVNKTVIVISAGTAFVITFGSSLTAALVESGGGWPKPAVWLCAALFGLVASGKDIRALMALPPVNGNSGITPKEPQL